jgi:hypothetical protein
VNLSEENVTNSSFVEIRCPIEASQLPKLGPDCVRIQLEPAYSRSATCKPTDRDFQILSDYLAEYPNVTFRVYGSYTVGNLDFLRFFRHHHHFAIDLYPLENFEGFRYLSDDLAGFYFGQTKRSVDLTFLGRFKALKELHLEGHRKGIETLSVLTNLRYLSLRSITLPDLSLLLPLEHLLDLEIRLGGTKNLQTLGEISKLRYLHLWLIRGLSDLAPIGRMQALQNLFLQALKNVTLLPDFGACGALRRVVLYQMKGIRDLSSLAAAPALDELAVLSMPQLTAESFRPLAASSSLRQIEIWLRSKKKHARVKKILGGRVSDKGGEFSKLLTGHFDYR